MFCMSVNELTEFLKSAFEYSQTSFKKFNPLAKISIEYNVSFK